jgi:hypothetical protein
VQPVRLHRQAFSAACLLLAALLASAPAPSLSWQLRWVRIGLSAPAFTAWACVSLLEIDIVFTHTVQG